MALTDRTRAAVQRARGVLDTLGMREHAVRVVVLSAPAAVTLADLQGERTIVGTPLTLDPSPLVRPMSARQATERGLDYSDQPLSVRRITRSHPGGGYTRAQLDPDPADGQIVVWDVAGEAYRLADLRDDRSHSYSADLTRAPQFDTYL